MITEDQVIQFSKQFVPEVISAENLSGFHNHVFRINGRTGFILRVSLISHRSSDDTMSEIDFLRYLIDNGATIAHPLQGLDGRFVYEFQQDNINSIVSAFSIAKGYDWLNRAPDGDDPNRLHQVGRTIGKIHQLSKSFQPVGKKLRRQWYQSQHLTQAEAVFQNSNPLLASAYSTYVLAMNQLPKTKESFGLVHGDFLFSNYHADGDTIVVFDFDECEYSWYVYDIAVSMYYYLLGGDPSQLPTKVKEAEELLYSLLSGYLLETKLDRFWVENINLFFQMREFVLLSSILSQSSQPSEGWQKTYIQGAINRQLYNKPFIEADFISVYNRFPSTMQQ